MKNSFALFKVLIMLAGLSVASLSHAIIATEQVKIQKALMTEDFAYLEDRFGKAQKSFELDTRNSKELEDLYGTLDSLIDSAKWFRVLYRLDQWNKKHPESYAALTARGQARATMAFLTRGGKFAPETSQEQFADMHRWNGMAREDLLASLKLTRHPLISHIKLFSIGIAEGDDKSKNRHFAEAYLIAPTSMKLHLSVMNSLRPRWGGSYAAMMAYIDKVNEHVKSERDLNSLRATIPNDMASTQDRLKNTKLAYDIQQKVLEFSRASGYLCTRAYYAETLGKPIEGILRDLQEASKGEFISPHCVGMAIDYAKDNFRTRQAVSLLDGYIQRLPYSNDLMNAKASVYIERGNIAAAVPVLLKSAELGDDWAQTLAGKHLVNGWGVTRDTKKGLELLRTAADNDYQDAQTNLIQALESLGRTEEANRARKRYGPVESNASTPSYTYR